VAYNLVRALLLQHNMMADQVSMCKTEENEPKRCLFVNNPLYEFCENSINPFMEPKYCLKVLSVNIVTMGTKF
jgi:hypothetical protein